MVNGVSGINSINSVYGVNGVYGIDSYRSYLNSYVGRTTSLSNTLFSQVTSDLSARMRYKGLQTPPSSYLAQLGNSIQLTYSASATLALSRKSVTSTDNKVVTATAQKYAKTASYTVKVSKLATGQVNKGTALAAAAPSVFNKGLNTIKIKSGTSEKNVSFVINEADTNKAALNKLSTAINSSNTGVSASVVTTSDNKAYLRLESAKTGSKNSFSLTDLNGNSVSAAGLNTVESNAQDAVYSVDGRQHISSSNTVSLDGGRVQATLKKADDTEVALDVTPDVSNSRIPDFYTYLSNTLSTGNYSRNPGVGTILDMLL